MEITLNLRDFIKELTLFYVLSGTEEQKRAKIETYIDIIGEKIYKLGYQKYDYRKLLRFLQIQCKSFPSIEEVLKYLPVGKVIDESYSGREGEVIKRVLNGYEYEFTIVPNHWDKIKTISGLDKELQWRQKTVNE